MDKNDEDWIRHTLLEYDGGKTMDRVLSIRPQEASSKGQNFASDMFRLHVQVLLKSGQEERMSLIFKKFPQSISRIKVNTETETFVKEAKMYRNVLHVLEELRFQKEGGEAHWPLCYGVRATDALLFNDLNALGFEMADRLKGLDFEHCKIAITTLAKFHALAATCIKKGIIEVQDLKVVNWYSDPEKLEGLYEGNVLALAKRIEDAWGEEWSKYAEAIRKFVKTMGQKATEYFNNTPGRFRTLNHGDCWVTNLLFKYNKNGDPERVRILDFQGSYYGHPGADITFFLQTSTNAETLPRKAELLELYHRALVYDLEKFAYPGEVPALEDILEGYQAARWYGATVALGLLPLVKVPAQLLPDIEIMFDAIVKNDKGLLKGCVSYEGEEFLNAMKFHIKEAYAGGILC